VTSTGSDTSATTPTAPGAPPTRPPDPGPIVPAGGIAGLISLVRLVGARLRGGELGSLPVVLGLIVIWTVFQTQNSHFLTANNLTNLALQLAATGTIAVGVFLVLLLGEIDLSVGWVSGLAASVMAVLSVRHGWNPVLAIVAALVLGLVIGAVQGGIFAIVGVPSFVVTLAGFIAWQGVQLKVLGSDGSINLPDGTITKLTSTFFTDATGWGLAAVAIASYVGAQLAEVRARRAAGLRPRPLLEVAGRSAVVAAAGFVAVGVMNADRGVPLVLVIFLALVIIVDLVTRRTAYGRHVFALGGNIEATRRAGVNVAFIRISVFALASGLAAAGGVLAASRLTGVTQSTGGSDTLLNAIAAAVIGGTSLFGGRGRAWSALLGILVIQSISNGMDLLGLDQSIKFIITGSVLLASVTLDALARRGRRSSGRG